ncbi:MAG TPA: DUF892 family protein [Actinomycetota bacterium]|nr:DUF892 family protein [Actinomycetota bacterium]
MNAADEKLVEYLRTAYAQEMGLVRTLQAHTEMSHDGEYKKQLQHHLTETVGHARKLRERLDELGYLADENVVQRTIGTVQSLATQMLAIAKGPYDVIRGKGDVAETMLKNARDEAMTEASEIATYIALERMAENLGDKETAAIAREIRQDEEQMLEKLAGLIRGLTDEVVSSQVMSRPAAIRKAS